MKKLALYRIWKIVWLALKVFTQLTWFKKRHPAPWTKEMELKWEELAGRQARDYKKVALQLEGLMIKLGQFLSTRADIMPRSFLKELEDLTDRVPPVPWEKAKDVLEAEWNTSYDRILQSISQEPIASASIGDVYKAMLPNGEEVAVKVQRPGIDVIIKTDFRAIRIILWLAKRFTKVGKQMDLASLYREMTRTIGDELNFRKELQNGRDFIERYKDFDKVKIPYYYEEWSTQRVLVMEWIEGSKITDLTFISQHNLGRKELANQLVNIFLEQLLNEGMFHADPHGGNILLKSDGTIVLIDFGMVGRINKQDAISVQRIVEGILFERYDKVIEGLEQLRFLLPNANKRMLEDVIRQLVEAQKTMEYAQLDSMMMDQLLIDIQDIVRNEPVQMPSEFAFFGRAISIFTGVLYTLDPEADLIEMCKPLLLKWIANRGEESDRSFGWKTVQRYVQPLLKLPNQIQSLLDEPKKYREFQERNAQQEREFQQMVTRRRDVGWMTLIPLTSFCASLFLEMQSLMYVFGSAVLVFGFVYGQATRKINKWLNMQDPYRKY
jgi:predicted unusual protein kinase regulating ubiquinone biosynthesis (AarF/ABC1/UbiB family)